MTEREENVERIKANPAFKKLPSDQQQRILDAELQTKHEGQPVTDMACPDCNATKKITYDVFSDEVTCYNCGFVGPIGDFQERYRELQKTQPDELPAPFVATPEAAPVYEASLLRVRCVFCRREFETAISDRFCSDSCRASYQARNEKTLRTIQAARKAYRDSRSIEEAREAINSQADTPAAPDTPET